MGVDVWPLNDEFSWGRQKCWVLRGQDILKLSRLKLSRLDSTQVESTQRSTISVYFGAEGLSFLGCPSEDLSFGGRAPVLMRRRGVICL